MSRARPLEEISAFEFYLRTGLRISNAHSVDGAEQKYNHWHDPDDGRFTQSGGGRYSGSGDSGQSRSDPRRDGGTSRGGSSKPAVIVSPPSSSAGSLAAKTPSVRTRAEKPVLKIPTRKEIIAKGDGRGRIFVRDNPAADGNPPAGEFPSQQEVTRYDGLIRSSARNHGVDPDLIRSVMYVETTHGFYDAPLRMLDLEKSIRPMNINTQYWGETWGSRADLRVPAKNVDAGARMLRAIQRAMPGAGIAKVATIYNDSNAKTVSSYGARVEAVYRSKPWLRGRRVILPAIY